jgi:predicted kinase
MTTSSDPVVVYVSGAPGAGKSTVAERLAHELGLVLVSKDVIKERLFDSVRAPADTSPLAWSRTLGGAAMELLWTLAAQQAPVLLEANFRPRSDYERGRLLGLGRRLVEVHCDCPPELAARRYARRSADGSRRLDVHPASTLAPELLAEFDGPVGIGALVSVDTAGNAPEEGFVGQVARLLSRSAG